MEGEASSGLVVGAAVCQGGLDSRDGFARQNSCKVCKRGQEDIQYVVDGYNAVNTRCRVAQSSSNRKEDSNRHSSKVFKEVCLDQTSTKSPFNT